MLYLYLGYIVAQSYAVTEKLVTSSISPLAMFFSIVVFIIWSSFPVAGYLVAKGFNAQGSLNSKALFICGFMLGFVENILFYLDILPYGWESSGSFIVFVMSFALAFVSLPKPVKLAHI